MTDIIHSRVDDKLHCMQRKCVKGLLRAPCLGQNNFRPLWARFKSCSQNGTQLFHGEATERKLWIFLRCGKRTIQAELFFLFVEAGKWSYLDFCVVMSHSFIIIREVLILTLSIFIAM